MRQIRVVPGLNLRFIGRDEVFNEGVEIGLLAAELASGAAEFSMTLGVGTLDQARALATGMGYRVHLVTANEATVELTFLTGSRRPEAAAHPRRRRGPHFRIAHGEREVSRRSTRLGEFDLDRPDWSTGPFPDSDVDAFEGEALMADAVRHVQMEQIVAGLCEGVILIEPDQTITYANPAAVAMHGVTEVGDLGGTVSEYRANFTLHYRNPP